MDPRLGRYAGLSAAAALACALAAGAQESVPAATSTPPVSGPAPVAAPDAPATPPSPNEAGSGPQTPPAGGPPPAGALGAAADQAAAPTDAAEPDEAQRLAKAAPAVPPTPPRAPSAILRVLDKVTAETMAFDAPIGRRVRFKSLVFEVKACETRDLGAPQPRPAAYLQITSDAGMSIGPVLGPRQVFKGWMFADAPGVHALTHPVYDAWLVSCSAAAPAT
jgi:hypothetical protein